MCRSILSLINYNLLFILFVLWVAPIYFFFFFFLIIRRPPSSPLFPYPPLFRSRPEDAVTCPAVLLGRRRLRQVAGLGRQGEWQPPDHQPDQVRPGLPRQDRDAVLLRDPDEPPDRKSTRLNSSHLVISHAVFCLK